MLTTSRRGKMALHVCQHGFVCLLQAKQGNIYLAKKSAVRAYVLSS